MAATADLIILACMYIMLLNVYMPHPLPHPHSGQGPHRSAQAQLCSLSDELYEEVFSDRPQRSTRVLLPPQGIPYAGYTALLVYEHRTFVLLV